MQSSTLIKFPKPKSEEPNDTLHTSRAEMTGQNFFSDLFNTPTQSRRQKKKLLALVISFSLILEQQKRLSTAIPSQWRKHSTISCNAACKISFGINWTCHVHEKEGFNLSLTYGVRYTYVTKHIVFDSDSPDEQMNNLWVEFLARLDEFKSLTHLMLILRVFWDKCVEITP